MFISEPNVFFCDLHNLVKYFSPKYSFSLNSDDKYDPELPITQSTAYGGTMIFWKSSLDPFISLHPVSTSSFLPLVFNKPGVPTSIHIALYMPTSGKESQFIEIISQLTSTIEYLKQMHHGAYIFLRGDSNVNHNNKERLKVYENFCSRLKLKNIPTNHKTYHHFLGNGLFDSSLDVILQSADIPCNEKVKNILCQDHFPEIDSHHDVIMSSISLPVTSMAYGSPADLISAPRVPNLRERIVWDKENLSEYEKLVSKRLVRIRKEWSIPNSPSAVSVLLELTNKALHLVASSTNKTISLSSEQSSKPTKVPHEIIAARKALKVAHEKLKSDLKMKSPNIITSKEMFRNVRKSLRFVTRKHRHKENLKRDKILSSILSQDPSKLYKTIRASRKNTSSAVPFITVGDKVYPRHQVADGLYDSIASLKKEDLGTLQTSPNYYSWSQDYHYIQQLCKNKQDIPLLALEHSTKILKKMKPHVSDFWSITPLHYLNAGQEGLIHFNFLLNFIINDINSASVKELNTVCALLLHKGHGKPKTNSRSYRTISSCPVLAKALDMYIHQLFITKWNQDQAATQYQGEGSNHDLAALLLTETIQYSLHISKEPLFLLFLDAKSAFDTVVARFLIRNLYCTGMEGKSLLYIDKRLHNRLTYCTWGSELMGPIRDERGLEQGGCNSSDNYKSYNNDLLKRIQKSQQGVKLGNGLTISGVGQADDVALVSNNIFGLFNILHLALKFCQEFHVELCADKTKLLMLSNNIKNPPIYYNPLKIYEKRIDFSENAEHVGVIRSTSGNLPHILNRIVAHKNALGAVLFTGAAHSHRGNLAGVTKVEKLYALPVLLSGVASLVLTKKEENIIDHQYTTSLSNLIKCLPNTPRSFVHFMSGSLPASAFLHLKQLSLFGMITRLLDDPLNKHAKNVLLTSPKSSKSWFLKIRSLCLQYGLPHPLLLLSSPKSKETFKKMCKSRVIDYWEMCLRSEADLLPSL